MVSSLETHAEQCCTTLGPLHFPKDGYNHACHPICSSGALLLICHEVSPESPTLNLGELVTSL